MRSLSFVKSFIIILLFLPLVAKAQLWSNVISSGRAIDWTGAGIVGYSSTGTLPSDSWTQCGATMAAGASSATILAALNHTGSGYTGCTFPSYVKLGAGTFNLTSGVVYVSSQGGTELRGSGASQTKLVFTGTSTCTGGSSQCLIGFSSSDNTYPSGPPAHIYTWTSGFSQGSTSITISSGTAIVANQTLLVLDQCNTGLSGGTCTTGTNTDNSNLFVCADTYSGGLGCAESGPDGSFARSERWQNEGILVTACSPACGSSGSTVVTLQRPLHHPNWSSGQTPQVYLMQPVQNVGVRDLAMDGSAVQAVAGVGLYNCYSCWVKGVTVTNNYNMGIYAWQTWHNDFSNNYFYNIGQETGAAPAYTDSAGIKLANSSDDLVANNIGQIIRVAWFEEGPAEGNVWAYNYAVNQYVYSDYMFQAILEHSSGDDYNLFEGNEVNQFIDDNSHGDHLTATNYRNWYWGWESCQFAQNCANDSPKDVAIQPSVTMSYSRYENWLANVLGTSGIETNYQNNTQSNFIQNGYIWGLGGGDSPSPADSIATASTYRWGNYDVVNAAVQWNTAEVPTGISTLPQSVPTGSCISSSPTCPASFYYTARPSWYFSSTPFPAIGPDVSGGNVGLCSGTLNASGSWAGLGGTSSSQCGSGNSLGTAWGGHVNAIPAFQAYLHFGGNLDGSSSALTNFDESYYASSLTSTTTTLTSSNYTPNTGSNITLTATLAPLSGPTGTVQFFDGGTSLGSSSVSSGIATWPVTGITNGTHTYTATYSGDSTYATSTSSPITVTASGSSGTGSLMNPGSLISGGSLH